MYLAWSEKWICPAWRHVSSWAGDMSPAGQVQKCSSRTTSRGTVTVCNGTVLVYLPHWKHVLGPARDMSPAGLDTWLQLDTLSQPSRRHVFTLQLISTLLFDFKFDTQDKQIHICTGACLLFADIVKHQNLWHVTALDGWMDGCACVRAWH